MRRRKCEGCKRYWWLVAFGSGLLVASFCPPRFVIAVLAVAVIVLGIISSKC